MECYYIGKQVQHKKWQILPVMFSVPHTDQGVVADIDLVIERNFPLFTAKKPEKNMTDWPGHFSDNQQKHGGDIR
jgi:hypothetical protein